MKRLHGGGREAFRCASVEAVDMGKLEVGQLAAGIRCDYLGLRVWLSLVGPKLEAGTKFREAVS